MNFKGRCGACLVIYGIYMEHIGTGYNSGIRGLFCAYVVCTPPNKHRSVNTRLQVEKPMHT